jgi:hypothetical protein
VGHGAVAAALAVEPEDGAVAELEDGAVAEQEDGAAQSRKTGPWQSRKTGPWCRSTRQENQWRFSSHCLLLAAMSAKNAGTARPPILMQGNPNGSNTGRTGGLTSARGTGAPSGHYPSTRHT